MATPIIMGSLSYTVMQFADQIMVARLGKTALAAAGAAGLAAFTLSTFFIGLVGSVSAFVAQSVGRNQRQNCARYTWQAIYISIATGLVALIFWPLSGPPISVVAPYPRSHPPRIGLLPRPLIRLRIPVMASGIVLLLPRR